MSADPDTGEIIKIEAPETVTLFGTSDPNAFIERAAEYATALKKIVDERKLFATIQGKQFPTVEAWTLIGSMVGVHPVVEWTRPVTEIADDSVETVVGYEARVEVRNMAGLVIGAAEAMCTRKEQSWRNRDDYALRSMAQTRATSKALRGPLDFIMKLAGYQATPAEEIPKGKDVPATKKSPVNSKFITSDAIRDILDNAKNLLGTTTNAKQVVADLFSSAGIEKSDFTGDGWVEALSEVKQQRLLDVLLEWEAKQDLPWDLPLAAEKGKE